MPADGELQQRRRQRGRTRAEISTDQRPQPRLPQCHRPGRRGDHGSHAGHQIVALRGQTPTPPDQPRAGRSGGSDRGRVTTASTRSSGPSATRSRRTDAQRRVPHLAARPTTSSPTEGSRPTCTPFGSTGRSTREHRRRTHRPRHRRPLARRPRSLTRRPSAGRARRSQPGQRPHRLRERLHRRLHQPGADLADARLAMRDARVDERQQRVWTTSRQSIPIGVPRKPSEGIW